MSERSPERRAQDRAYAEAHREQKRERDRRVYWEDHDRIRAERNAEYRNKPAVAEARRANAKAWYYAHLEQARADRRERHRKTYVPIRYAKVCRQCGRSFETKVSRAIYCRPRCSWPTKVARATAARRAERAAVGHFCCDCGMATSRSSRCVPCQIAHRKAYSAARQKATYVPKRHTKVCPQCDVVFECRYVTRVYCSKRCKDKGTYDPVRRRAEFERYRLRINATSRAKWARDPEVMVLGVRAPVSSYPPEVQGVVIALKDLRKAIRQAKQTEGTP